MYKKKYAKGELITSLDEMMKQDFVFWGNKIMSYGWFQNLYMAVALRAVKSNRIFKAVKIEEESNENN